MQMVGCYTAIPPFSRGLFSKAPAKSKNPRINDSPPQDKQYFGIFRVFRYNHIF